MIQKALTLLLLCNSVSFKGSHTSIYSHGPGFKGIQLLLSYCGSIFEIISFSFVVVLVVVWGVTCA